VSGGGTPETPRDASTVVLVRDAAGGAGVEVFLMRRHAQVGFLGGMHLFPGGKVDAPDRDPALHALIQAEDLAAAPRRLGEDIDVPTALGLFMAAFRETFEESGLIPGAAPEVEPARLAARAKLAESGFLAAVQGLGAPLDLDAMEPFSRWITPVVETRRFDARFFLTEAPAHQEGLADGEETDSVLWIGAREALSQHAAGELNLLPPTWMTLSALAAFDSAAEAMASTRTTPTPRVQPELVSAQGGFTLCFPGDPAHSVSTQALPGPTRLTLDAGRWRAG
jgi:8-oxo-dGTP pyrophosphatase MutT (NUDIX family)